MAEFALPPNVVASEFAAVAVDIDHGANGPRLRLTDLNSDRVAYLDAMELDTLLWLPEGVLESWHDPSRYRWRDPDAPAPSSPGPSSPVPSAPPDRNGQATT